MQTDIAARSCRTTGQICMAEELYEKALADEQS
jgi:hypothetical protein